MQLLVSVEVAIMLRRVGRPQCFMFIDMARNNIVRQGGRVRSGGVGYLRDRHRSLIKSRLAIYSGSIGVPYDTN